MTRPERVAPWRAALRSMQPEERARVLRAELLQRHAARKGGAAFEGFRHDPVGFSREVLGVAPWSRQAEVMQAVDVHRHVYVRSGQKTGKSTAAACVALWWVTTRPRGTVVMTSSNAQQVKAILWRELRRIYQDAGCSRTIGGLLHKDPATGFDMGDGRAIYGLTADDAERIAGYSGDELLFIIDESSGFDDDLHEAIEGNLGGGGHELAMGNPTRATGWFIKGFKSAVNKRIHIDSRESPNVVEGRKVVPGLATKEFVEELIAKYGIDHPVVQVRICGDPPDQGERSVVPLSAWTAAKARWIALVGAARDDATIQARLRDAARSAEAEMARTKTKTATPWTSRLHIGVDVARFGDDDSAIAPRRGDFVYPLGVVHGFDTVAVAGLALQRARALRSEHNERPVINVDVDGLGAGVADQLRRHSDVEVQDVSSASSASQKDEYHARRDEGWWGLREWLQAGGMVPPDDELEEEALAPVYGFDAQNRIHVEKKDAIKKRLGRSPDRADALWLSIQKHHAMRSFRVKGI